jgi:hypothetical protein
MSSAVRIYRTSQPLRGFFKIQPMDPKEQKILDELRRRRAAKEAQKRA